MTLANAFATFLHSAFYSGLIMIAAMSVVVGLIMWAEAGAEDTAGGIPLQKNMTSSMQGKPHGSSSLTPARIFAMQLCEPSAEHVAKGLDVTR